MIQQIYFFKLHSAFCYFQTTTVDECCSIKLLPYILFEKHISEMASPGNQHCAGCTGTLALTVRMLWTSRALLKASYIEVSLQPMKCCRWRAWPPMNASCNWVDLFRSVQFIRCKQTLCHKCIGHLTKRPERALSAIVIWALFEVSNYTRVGGVAQW